MVTDISQQSPKLPYAVRLAWMSNMPHDPREKFQVEIRHWLVEHIGVESKTALPVEYADDGGSWFEPPSLLGRLWLFRQYPDALAFVMRWKGQPER